jgi:hypothetical protein
MVGARVLDNTPAVDSGLDSKMAEPEAAGQRIEDSAEDDSGDVEKLEVH